jgi:hypothetical protein
METGKDLGGFSAVLLKCLKLVPSHMHEAVAWYTVYCSS